MHYYRVRVCQNNSKMQRLHTNIRHLSSSSALFILQDLLLSVAMEQIGIVARKAAQKLATTTVQARNACLRAIVAELETNLKEIVEANALDIAEAERTNLDDAVKKVCSY